MRYTRCRLVKLVDELSAPKNGIELVEFGNFVVSRIEILITNPLQVGNTKVTLQVLAGMPRSTHRKPQAIGIRNRSGTILVIVHRRDFVAYATANGELVIDVVVSTDGEEPGIYPVIKIVMLVRCPLTRYGLSIHRC